MASLVSTTVNGNATLGNPANGSGSAGSAAATITTLKGYSVQYDAGGSGARLTNTGWLGFHTGAGWTSNERMWAFTNANNMAAVPRFALLRGNANNVVPTLGNNGSLGTNTLLTCFWTKDGDFYNSGSVGIGTETPTTKLHVYGNNNVGNLPNLAAQFSATGTGGLGIGDENGNEPYIGLLVATDDFHIKTGGNNKRVTILSSGSVGIGTTNPGYKLEVKASVTGNWLSRIYNTATSGNSSGLLVRMDEPGSTGIAFGVYANGGYKFRVEPDGETQILSGSAYTTHLNYQNSGNHYISMGNSGFTNFRGGSNGITTMTVKGDGKVGIKDTSPQTALSVNGEASFGDQSRLSLIGLNIASSAASPNIKIRTKIPFALSGADFTVNIKGFIYGNAETANLTVCWHYYNSTFYNATCSSAGSWAPTIQLSAEDWDSSGTKKVCICLSTPGYWVKAYVESMFSNNYADTYADGWTWVDGTASGTGNDLASLSYRSDFGNNFKMLSNGCVGIGGGILTNAQLTVNGAVAIGDATYNSNMNNGAADFSVDCNGTPMISWIGNYLQVGGTGQNWSMKMYNSLIQTYSNDLTIIGGGTGTTHKLHLGTNGQTQTITCNNGSVGIGTTAPSAKLTIAGGQLGTTLNIESKLLHIRSSLDGNTGHLEIKDVRTSAGTTWTTSGRRIQMKVDSTYMAYIQFNGTGNNYGLSFGAGSSGSAPGNSPEAMRIVSSGSVGIGTTNPISKFHVAGNAEVGDTSQQTTVLTIRAQNTAGAPAATTQIRMKGYEGRGIGTFYEDSSYSGQEWFCGMNYSAAFGTWNVGYDASGGQAEYNANTLFRVRYTGRVEMLNYGSGTFTGTAAYKLAVDASGNIIETAVGSGQVDGSGTANYITRWTDTDTIGNSNIFDNGTIGIGTAANLNGKVTIREAGNSGTPNHIFCMLSSAAVGHGAAIFLKTSTSNTNNRYGARIRAIRNDNNNAAADLAFSLENTGATAVEEKVRITSDGHVGIGTTSPSNSSSAAARDLVINRADHAGITIYNSAADKSGNIYFADAGSDFAGFISYTHSNNNMLFGANATTIMTLSDDNVDLTGDLTLAGDSASRFYFGSKRALEGQISNNFLDVGEDFGSTRMRSSTSVYPTNNITLGTSANRWTTIYGAAGNFSGNLTVSGTITNGGFYSAGTGYVSLTSNNPSIRFLESDTTNTNWDIQVNSGTLKFLTVYDNHTNFSEKFTITNGGTVNVNNNARIHATGTEGTPTLALGYGYSSAYRLSFYTDTEAGYISNKHGNNGIRFRHREQTVMQVGVGGSAGTPYVGIGTTNPSALLHVNGTIITGNPSTTGGSWLEKNYSGANKINVLSSHYSSGNTIIGYGAKGKTSNSGFVATYGNFSGNKSVLEVAANAFYFKTTDSAAQNTIGDDITLTTRLQVEKTAMTFTSSDGSGLIVNRTGSSAYLQFYPAYSNVPTIMGKGAGGLHLSYNSSSSGIRIDTSNNVIIKDNILFFGSTTGPFVSNDSTVLRLAGDGGVKIQTYVSGWQDRLTIIDDGNVGIGTTNPSQKLDVNGNTELNGSVNMVGGNWLSFDGEQVLRKSSSWLYLADGGFTSGLYTRIKIRVDGYDISPYQDTANVTSATTLGLSTKRWYNVYSQAGDISGDLDLGGNLIVGEGGNNKSIKVRHIDGKDYDSDDASGLFLNNSNQQGVYVGSPPNNANFYVRGAADVTGNLTVGGTATVQPSAGDGILTLKNSAGSQILRIDQNSIRTTTTHHITLFTDGNSNQLRLYSDGKVGIGTVTPYKTFQVNWSSSDTTITTGNGLLGGGAGAGMLIQNTSSTAGIYANLDFRAYDADARIALKKAAGNTGDFYFIHDNDGSANTSVVMRSNGSVGIGTTNPTTRLEVHNGSIWVKNTGTNSYAYIGDKNGPNPYVLGGTTIFKWVTRNSAASSVLAYSALAVDSDGHLLISNGTSNYTPRIAISASTGNVGIGTTAHGSYKHYVYGSTGASGTKYFDMPHPDPSKKADGYRLRHGAVEAPAFGENLYRFTVTIPSDEGTVTTDLPGYFTFLNENPQIWIQARNMFARAYGEINEGLTSFTVTGEKTGQYDVLIIGSRKAEASDKDGQVFTAEYKD